MEILQRQIHVCWFNSQRQIDLNNQRVYLKHWIWLHIAQPYNFVAMLLVPEIILSWIFLSYKYAVWMYFDYNTAVIGIRQV